MGTAMESTATDVGHANSLGAELFSARMYKPSQGKVVRQLTCGAIWLAFAIGAWKWHVTSFGFVWLADRVTPSGYTGVSYGLPFLLLMVGLWIGFRIVNYPRFADFLIAVEAEMNKVTWPSQDELVRSSIVVILLLAAFTGILFLFDLVWVKLFTWIGIR